MGSVIYNHKANLLKDSEPTVEKICGCVESLDVLYTGNVCHVLFMRQLKLATELSQYYYGTCEKNF